jgi:DNA repair protein RecN (Recombination protein N)
MLEFLRIHNLALIKDMELEFAPGLNVLTGETGAGKSFILKAVNFLTGQKLSRDHVRSGADKALVEAIFIEGTEETIVRRELSVATGRSRLFINDRLSSVETIAKRRSSLFLHTSQHGQQQLLKPSYQARIVDGFVPESDLFEQRAGLLAQLKDISEQRAALQARHDELAQQRDFLEFQKKEIDKIAPRQGEEEELEAKRQTLRHRREVNEAAQNALDLLNDPHSGISDAMGKLSRQLTTLAQYLPEFADDAATVEDLNLQLADIDGRLRRMPSLDHGDNPEAIESRLYELSSLRRKLGKSLDQIVHLARDIEDNLSFLDSCALDLKALRDKETQAADKLRDILAELDAARQDAAATMCARLKEELSHLGFSKHAEVRTEFAPVEIHPGIDENRARILWVPNPGMPPQPLDAIASGGELSRFLLALTNLISAQELPTLIFDEVDAGVGGLTLNSMADRLELLAKRQQMILITHWPQLAARAARHFTVVKDVDQDQTFTRCQPLDSDGIMAELARMAGGGEQGRALAEQLRLAGC